jgi:hypothetical protein
MGAESGEVSAMIFDLGSDRADEVHEVLLNHANDVEAIRDDRGIGEVFADQGAVGAAQIHADDPHGFLSLEGAEVGFEILGIPAFDDIEDPVGAQVAEGGRELRSPSMSGALSMDGVFVDAEDRRADSIEAFPGFDLGVFMVEAFDGGGANAFAMREDAACDAVAVVLVDRLPEGFGGVAVSFDAGQWWDEGSPTATALVAAGVDAQVYGPAEGVEVTHVPEIGPLAVDLQSPGLATLVWGSLRSTARAIRARCLVPLQMHDRVEAMLLDVLDLIPCNSDLF